MDEIADGSQGRVCLANALDPATFRGDQDVIPYPRRGRISDSRNIPFDSFFNSIGRFIPADAIKERLSEPGLLDGLRAIIYCAGGIAASLVASAAYLMDARISQWMTAPCSSGHRISTEPYKLADCHSRTDTTMSASSTASAQCSDTQEDLTVRLGE